MCFRQKKKTRIIAMCDVRGCVCLKTSLCIATHWRNGGCVQNLKNTKLFFISAFSNYPSTSFFFCYNYPSTSKSISVTLLLLFVDPTKTLLLFSYFNFLVNFLFKLIFYIDHKLINFDRWIKDFIMLSFFSLSVICQIYY